LSFPAAAPKVPAVKLLRHGPLTFWLLACVFLAGVLVVARTTGGELSAVSNPTRTDLVAAVRLETAQLTLAVRGDLASLADVHDTASSISAHAKSAQSEASTAMTSAWLAVENAAAELSALTELDSEATERALVALNNATDELSAAALGVQPLTTPAP
jgi:hypothetical protein